MVVNTWPLRAWRSWAALGRSGVRLKRDSPALASAWPCSFHSTTSLATSWSRRRSTASPAPAWLVADRLLAAARVLAARSALRASSVVRPRLSPALRADSTRTSNQVSMERDTNWYDTV